MRSTTGQLRKDRVKAGVAFGQAIHYVAGVATHTYACIYAPTSSCTHTTSLGIPSLRWENLTYSLHERDQNTSDSEKFSVSFGLPCPGHGGLWGYTRKP